jgi:hypothetical protein
MNDIRDVLKNKYELDIDVEYGIIIGDNGNVKIQITPPSGTQTPYRTTWRLRMHPSASFETWACNHVAICEEFAAVDLMIEYLSDVATIYNLLFVHLADSYKTVARMLKNTHRF